MDVYVARQPIFDRSQEVVAYELLYRDTNINSYGNTLKDSVATSILLLNSYLNVGMTLLTDNKKGFVNFGPHLIMEDIPLLLSKDRVVIELLESVKPDDHLITKLKELKKAGYIIALDDYIYSYPYDNLVEIADIIKVDFIGNTEREIRKICGKLKPLNKILLAEKVENKEQFDWARRIGFEFFQGYFFSKPLLLKTKKLSGTSYNYMQILEELELKEPDYKKISDVIESEISLAYKLLKLVNSSFSLIDNVSSIQHALSILGIDAFYKWFTLATIHQLGGDKPNEIVKLAMVRMKFMENVGESSVYKQHTHSLRLIGLLSVIDALLEEPMDKVMEQLPISINIKDTLLGKDTIYSQVFKLILQYEMGDFVEAKAIAEQINLDFSKFPDLYTDSIKWTEDLMKFLEEAHEEVNESTNDNINEGDPSNENEKDKT